jgi:GH15 family glucan-1,4-alpha-glucosidase
MMMEYMLSTVCNHLQLSSEMFSIATGRNLGNFPQAFSHVGIINAALDLSDYA